MSARLQAAVLDCIIERGGRFTLDGGAPFEAITETDLAYELRERGWRLPRGWLSDVKAAGFKTVDVGSHSWQGSPRELRRHFDEPSTINPETGRPFAYSSHQRRALRNCTVITL
jgi:hypothetical protein